MASSQIDACLEATPAGVALKVKVVPGASRSRLAGLLGDRLKVAVAAAPEGGKANKALCKLLAGAFGLAARDVTVVAGHTGPQKTIELTGLDVAAARSVLQRLVRA